MLSNARQVTRKPSVRKLKFKSKVLNTETLKSADLVLLATDHDDFDYKLIEKEASLIVDTRGRYNSSRKIFISFYGILIACLIVCGAVLSYQLFEKLAFYSWRTFFLHHATLMYFQLA